MHASLRRGLTAAGLLTLTTAALAAPTAALAQAPAAPCGPTLSDPEGDMEFTNRDILAGYVRSDAGTTTVAMVLKEITFSAPSPTATAGGLTQTSRHEWNEGDSMNYRTAFTVGGKRWYVQASVIAKAMGSTVSYEYGTVDGDTVTKVGGTTGSVGTGKNAVVSVVVPGVVGAKVGTQLQEVVAANQNVGNLPGGLQNVEGGDVMPGGTHSSPIPVRAEGAGSLPVLDCAATAGGGGSAGVGATAAETRVVSGASTRITAAVTGVAAGTTATLVREKDGKDTTIATKVVGADGRVLFRVKPTVTTSYQVVVGASRSLPVSVIVLPTIKATGRAAKGGGLLFAGTFSPADAARVDVQRRVDGEWFAEASGAAKAGRFRIVARKAERGGIYRIVVRGTALHGPRSTVGRRVR